MLSGLISLPSEIFKISGRLFPCFVTGSLNCLTGTDFAPGSEPFIYEREQLEYFV